MFASTLSILGNDKLRCQDKDDFRFVLNSYKKTEIHFSHLVRFLV